MNNIKIDKDIKLPTRATTRGHSKYDWTTLESGDSILCDNANEAQKVFNSIKKYFAWNTPHLMVVTRKENDKIRVYIINKPKRRLINK